MLASLKILKRPKNNFYSFQGTTGGKNSGDATNNPSSTAQTEGAEKKLENPYYYYGSTRNQKNKAKLLPQFQKPKPLLPSQRQALELQTRTGGKSLLSHLTDRPKSRQEQPSLMQQNKPPSRPSSRQALLQQHQQIIPDSETLLLSCCDLSLLQI